MRYHLLAHAKDGDPTYHGNCVVFRPEEDWAVEITCYTAVNGSAILFGDWHEKDSGQVGPWLCRLKPNMMQKRDSVGQTSKKLRSRFAKLAGQVKRPLAAKLQDWWPVTERHVITNWSD